MVLWEQQEGCLTWARGFKEASPKTSGTQPREEGGEKDVPERQTPLNNDAGTLKGTTCLGNYEPFCFAVAWKAWRGEGFTETFRGEAREGGRCQIMNGVMSCAKEFRFYFNAVRQQTLQDFEAGE